MLGSSRMTDPWLWLESWSGGGTDQRERQGDKGGDQNKHVGGLTSDVLVTVGVKGQVQTPELRQRKT